MTFLGKIEGFGPIIVPNSQCMGPFLIKNLNYLRLIINIAPNELRRNTAKTSGRK
jgi:hypothetical protein